MVLVVVNTPCSKSAAKWWVTLLVRREVCLLNGFLDSRWKV